MKTLIIVNPASAGGVTMRRWPRIRELLLPLFEFDAVFSQYPRHAIDLARQARIQGVSRIICVGGDGTLNEVANGAYSAASDNPMPVLAIIPAGTGADFARTAGIPHNVDDACARLVDPSTMVSDLGVVSFVGKQGPERRYFVNAAGLGYDAEVVSRRNGFNRYMRGTIPYLASLAATLLTYTNKEITISTGESRTTQRANAVVVAVGRYFGGGMRIAPGAELADGLFDIVTIGDVGRAELVYNFPRVYRGTHLRHPKVSVERAKAVAAESLERVLVQADGEVLGELPAHFEIIPGALTFLT